MSEPKGLITNPNGDNSSPSSVPVSNLNSELNNLTLSAKVSASYGIPQNVSVVLSTALVKVYDKHNRAFVVRAILDSGSTASFVSERLCKRLNLETNEVDGSVCGINNVTSHVGKMCQIQMTSLNNTYATKLYCFILPLISSDVPCQKLDISDLNIPHTLSLADPTFHEPSKVDILIGADIFWDLLGSQIIKLGLGMPVLCETRLGWIISGPVTYNHVKFQRTNIKCNFTHIVSPHKESLDKLRTDLMRFWQLEETALQSTNYLPEEKLCEEHFVKNVTRLSNGRFCVRIPLKHNPSVLGESFQRATHCLYAVERKLRIKPDFGKLYHEFMNEYKMLHHMTEVKGVDNTKSYFIPHHGILREGSTTTKLRVVFNASSPTSSGVSLNCIQMVGPTVQDDLLSILLRFRLHKYVLSADVEKMYRQIMVHPSDRCFQQILWRSSPTEPIKTYQLNTVTYGTASAPFLATRCLKEIASECKNKKISEIIEHDFYVDDLLTGADTLNEIKSIRTEVTEALASACMPLRKWKSNEPGLVSDELQTSLDLNIGSHESNKLLGVDWFAATDELGFVISSVPLIGRTKRDLLSAIARIFDPLGILSPCIVTMKMLLQKLWLDNVTWDEPLTTELNTTWTAIAEALPLLNNFRIPRLVVCDSYKSLELHVFTDASERAYGACVYVRSINDNGECTVGLLTAKSRVAPIKPTTIPRLELCGALVGARLYEKVSKSLRVHVNHVYCWTDSTIVLGWLQMLPSKLQPFVRNRVAEILDKAGNCIWRHVPNRQKSSRPYIPWSGYRESAT
ncbi:uncharacterized protein LOC131851357 [Achroia grisella]|uniref:uncharacterized protein LOC131851357 n=1 Tax=Achroia grisella TaxID=688607 RepID=UPI0027D26ADC|nr:uncharacterized protein LOC131851357 [Achroia grisella]